MGSITHEHLMLQYFVFCGFLGLLSLKNIFNEIQLILK